jgi:hypothetical protein
VDNFWPKDTDIRLATLAMRSSLTAANILKSGADQCSARLQNERGSRRRANYVGVVPLRGARQERKEAVLEICCEYHTLCDRAILEMEAGIADFQRCLVLPLCAT